MKLLTLISGVLLVIGVFTFRIVENTDQEFRYQRWENYQKVRHELLNYETEQVIVAKYGLKVWKDFEHVNRNPKAYRERL